MSKTPYQDLQEDLKVLEFRKEFVAASIKADFGIKIYLARRNAGLTQAQLAEKAGVTKAYIVKLERGEGNPKLSTIGAILAAMNLTLPITFKEIKDVFPNDEDKSQIR